MKLEEPICVRGCAYISSLDDDDLRDIVYDEKYSNTETNRYIKQIKGFCAGICVNARKNGVTTGSYLHKQTYRFAKGRTDGRLHVSRGLQNIQHDIRSLLCRDYCVDLDMKAAHPTIFLHLAKEEGIQTPTLQRLLDDRDTFLSENDVTKNDINKMLNQDKPKNLHTSDLKELANEFLKVKEILYIKNKDTIKSKEKRYNIKSSVVNHLLCRHENILLQRVVEKYRKHIHALCFDGFLFDKNIPIEISSLNELTKDYGVVWAKKPMGEHITIPSDFVEEPTYEDIKARFELNHAICLDPPCFIKKTPYDNLMMKKCDFMDAVACEEVLGRDNKPIFDFNQWIKDPSRRAYNKIDFHPFHDNEEDPTPDDVYNSFRPFAAKYVKKEDRHKDTGAFRDHLKTNMCNDDEVGSDWLYKLFAWRFQNPNKLPEVGVVLKGLQGSGKDRLMDIMTRIMGSSNDYIHRTEEVGDLFGKFTPALKHKLFVQLNEMEGKAGCDNKEKLKGAITKDVNYINEKNLKPYYLVNLALIIVCSNNLTPVQIPYDCRRWVVYQTGRKNIGNMPFWEWFSALISDDHWIDSVFSELIDEDLTGWRPDDIRLQPKTKAYTDTQEDSIPSLYKYLRENDCDYPRKFTKYEGKSKKLCGKYFVDGKEMWINAKDWIEDEGLREIKGGTQTMNKMLREIEGIEISKQVEINGGKQKRVTVLDREAVMKEMYTRIFKNITFEEVEVIETQCMISSPREESGLDKGVEDLVKESGRGWDSD
jgi:hypothetical protein